MAHDIGAIGIEVVFAEGTPDIRVEAELDSEPLGTADTETEGNSESQL